MPFKIVRNDITKMTTDAIVNTANNQPIVGTGCDHAVYAAAGYDELLQYRKDHVGFVQEGDVFITPGFRLPAKYIIHAVSPRYKDGRHNEEELLRSCYRKTLALAKERGFQSIAFPLISTGGFGYPKEEGMRIAVDEIHAFLLTEDMQVYLVVFDEKATQMGNNLYPDLESYIDCNYVQEKQAEEYWKASSIITKVPDHKPLDEDALILEIDKKLKERMEHMSDSFTQYLLYLINRKGLKNTDVYKRAILDKKVFSKIINNKNYHPKKKTVLQLCIGMQLHLSEARDLLARAGYAFSPCDKTDVIFSYFIEHEIYDMIDLDIQLEEHGLACIIT